MGLDVRGYSNIELVGSISEEGWEVICDCDDLLYIYSHNIEEFPEAAEGLQAQGLYLYEDTESGRISSYSGYGMWRDTLSRAILGVPAEEVWDDPDAFAGKPFVELINFSDCDGKIGTRVCTKLYETFMKYDPRIDIMDEDWFVDIYETFIMVFNLGRKNGCVEFC
jgi:hypothetical protein